MSIKDRGFASMDKAKQALIASSGGKKAHALGTAHRWTSAEASKAGRLGKNKPHRNAGIYNTSPDAMRSRLLTLLQDFLRQHPGKPVSFVALAKELDSSRQYISTIYHQLKKEYKVPPIGTRGFGANEENKKHIFRNGKRHSQN